MHDDLEITDNSDPRRPLITLRQQRGDRTGTLILTVQQAAWAITALEQLCLRHGIDMREVQ